MAWKSTSKFGLSLFIMNQISHKSFYYIRHWFSESGRLVLVNKTRSSKIDAKTESGLRVGARTVNRNEMDSEIKMKEKIEPGVLLGSIRDAEDLESLKEIVTSSKKLDAFHYSAACSQIYRLSVEKENRTSSINILNQCVAGFLDTKDKLSVDSKLSLNIALCSVLHAYAKNKVFPKSTDHLIFEVARDLTKTCGGFDSRGIAGSLWSVASIRITDPSIVAPIVRNASRLAGSFTEQHASNSLWALASLGIFNKQVVKPFVHSVFKVSDSMTPQGACNSFWALAVMNRESDAIKLSKIPRVEEIISKHLQSFNSRQLLLCDALFDILNSKDRKRITNALASLKREPYSATVLTIFENLKKMGFDLYEEVLYDKLFPPMMVFQNSKSENFCVEYAGPSQFNLPSADGRNPRKHGGSILRHRLIQKAGYNVLYIPYYEWKTSWGPMRGQSYLQEKLTSMKLIANDESNADEFEESDE